MTWVGTIARAAGARHALRQERRPNLSTRPRSALESLDGYVAIRIHSHAIHLDSLIWLKPTSDPSENWFLVPYVIANTGEAERSFIRSELAIVLRYVVASLLDIYRRSSPYRKAAL